MPRKLAIFDMDGTILDSLRDIFTSLNHALAANGQATITFEQCRSFVGNGIFKLIERAAPQDASQELRDSIHAAFTEHYQIHCNDTTRPYDGIQDTIRRLRRDGWMTAVISNKPDYGVQELYKLHFDGLFDAVTGDVPGFKKKPAPDLVDRILQLLGVSRSEAVFIGDSEVDIKTAANTDMDCIAVTWGFRKVEWLLEGGATVLVDTPQALYERLCAMR